MLKGIDQEELKKNLWRYDKEVHDAVKKGESSIDTHDKETELLRYLQKVAEHKRLYYQWIYTWVIFILSAVFAVLLNITLNKIIEPDGSFSLSHFEGYVAVVGILAFLLLIVILLLYYNIIKPRFRACHDISLGIEREIQAREIMKESNISKLDVINIKVESINQRINAIEKEITNLKGK